MTFIVGILCDKLSFLLHLVYLFRCSCVSVWTHGYSFCSLSYDPVWPLCHSSGSKQLWESALTELMVFLLKTCYLHIHTRYIQVCALLFFFQVCALGGVKYVSYCTQQHSSNRKQISTQIYISKYHCPSKRQGKFKISLEHLVERKDGKGRREDTRSKSKE